jgi:AcrR family transcriptional regulator
MEIESEPRRKLLRNRVVRQETRESILDAVDRLLERKGYKKMKVDDIAEEVGIGKGTIYLHFSSKADLTLAHIDRIVERLLVQLNEIADSSATPVRKLHSMTLTRVLMRFDSVQHYPESINDLLAELRSHLLARRRKHFEDEASVFERVLEEGKQKKVFSLKDSRATAQTFLHATNSLLPYSLSVQELGDREEIAEKVTRIADLLVQGVVRR